MNRREVQTMKRRNLKILLFVVGVPLFCLLMYKTHPMRYRMGHFLFRFRAHF